MEKTKKLEEKGEDLETSSLLAKPDPACQAGLARPSLLQFLKSLCNNVTAILLGLSFFYLTYQFWTPPRNYTSECLHALGGGAVGARGSLLHYDPKCTEQLKLYFQYDYFPEVRAVSDEAIAYFRQHSELQDRGREVQAAQQRAAQARQAADAATATGTDPDPDPDVRRGTVIFDIDETALSNMDGFFPPTAPLWWGRPPPPAVCARPHLEFVQQRQDAHGPHGGCRKHGAMGPAQQEQQPGQAEPRGAAAAEAAAVLGASAGVGADGGADVDGGVLSRGRPLCSSPPLAASLDLFNFLVDNNYTVVFLTGRSEDLRADTEANLAEAGYGWKCGDDRAAAAAAAAAAAQAPTAGAGSGAGGGRPGCWLSRVWSWLCGRAAPQPAAAAQRCYGELIMREVGDERLASVFKAEARAALVASGRQPPLVGNIGDQFSDLTGQASAPASWKLPNPVYTLL
ncbi:hypothetical protein GPECTOR_2g1044 [Gonium pectorale]|uniref:Acid phosphatase n=1 Tax=Gonium pectorale TaxID=33097 RepID=A0A150H094_GONPE|nr:hypothetical protein GPECTOR_2g1044 [Gonium pectorale]|eukprot:KXZ55495.1 hypothetical protein GPECTOR_2g1044 [Gonium pectorale]